MGLWGRKSPRWEQRQESLRIEPFPALANTKKRFGWSYTLQNSIKLFFFGDVEEASYLYFIYYCAVHQQKTRCRDLAFPLHYLYMTPSWTLCLSVLGQAG